MQSCWLWETLNITSSEPWWRVDVSLRGVGTNLRKKDKACDSLVWETLGLHIWAHNINLHIFDVVLIIVLFYKYWCPIFCSQRWMIRMGALLFIYIDIYRYYRILCMNKFNLAPWSKLDYWVGKLLFFLNKVFWGPRRPLINWLSVGFANLSGLQINCKIGCG